MSLAYTVHPGETSPYLKPSPIEDPAKYSKKLIQWIMQHLTDLGVPSGATILDPFAGTGLGAWAAMQHSYRFLGVELERPFIDITNGCACTGMSRADWVQYYGRWERMRYQKRHWCPRCLQQASQQPAKLLVKRTFPHQGKRVTRTIAPLPFPDRRDGVRPLPAPQASLFGAAPTTAYARNSHTIPHTAAHRYDGNLDRWRKQGLTGATVMQGDSRQVCELLQGQVACCVSSPPYAESIRAGHDPAQDIARALRNGHTTESMGNPGGQLRYRFEYSTTPANLGNSTPDTFWSAAKAILTHAYHLLVPGGIAVWVTGPYVRDGQLVDFPAQWRTLAASLGFQTICEHRMRKRTAYGTQVDAFTGEQEVNSSYVSFFRRNNNKKGGPLVDYEMVTCMRKPRCAAPMPPDEAWHQGELWTCQAMGTSPPYSASTVVDGRAITDAQTHTRDIGSTKDLKHGYSHNPVNLGNLPTGTPPDTTP